MGMVAPQTRHERGPVLYHGTLQAANFPRPQEARVTVTKAVLDVTGRCQAGPAACLAAAYMYNSLEGRPRAFL